MVGFLRIFGLLAPLLLVGCGNSHYDVGPFATYVRTYKAEGLHYGHTVPITDLEMSFKEVNEDLQGYCTFVPAVSFDGMIRFDLVPTIYIDPEAWDEGDQWDHEALILHELGHCLMARPHDSRLRDEDGLPRSLMFPSKLLPGVYYAHRDYYLNEFFHPPASQTQ